LISHPTSSSSSADAEVEKILQQGQPVSDVVAVSDVSARSNFIGADLTAGDFERNGDVVVTVTEVLDLEFIEETEVVTVIESVSDPVPPPSETWALGRPKMSARVSPVAGKLPEDSEDGKFLTGILNSAAKDWTEEAQPDKVSETAAAAGKPLGSESSTYTDRRENQDEENADSAANVFTLSSSTLSDIPVDPTDGVPPLPCDVSSRSTRSADSSLSSDASSFQAMSDRFVLTEEETSLMTDSCRRLFDQSTTSDVADSSKRETNGFEPCQFWISEEGAATSSADTTWPSVMYSFDKPDTGDDDGGVKGTTYSTPTSSSECRCPR
jgi:hypothetical protein